MMHMLSGGEQVSGNGCKRATDLNSVWRRAGRWVWLRKGPYSGKPPSRNPNFFASSCDRNESEPLHPTLLH